MFTANCAKKTGENKFELIDGQQRLTTIFIILKYIQTIKNDIHINYNLSYETRAKSKDFLDREYFDMRSIGKVIKFTNVQDQVIALLDIE